MTALRLSSLGGGAKPTQRGTAAVPGHNNSTFTIALATSVSNKHQLRIYNDLSLAINAGLTISVSGNTIIFDKGSSGGLSWPYYLGTINAQATCIAWELSEFN